MTLPRFFPRAPSALAAAIFLLCPGWTAAATLYPDLIPWGKGGAYLADVAIDISKRPGRKLLIFSGAFANRGAGTFELVGEVQPDGTTRAIQRIYRDDGSFEQHFAGEFVFHGHEDHNHFHYGEFAAYRLRAVAAGNRLGSVVRASDKVSFAMFDVDAYDLSLPGAPRRGVYRNPGPDEPPGQPQGISVGWADVYARDLWDQWIDITGLPDGTYWLEKEVDPRRRLIESNEDNNKAWAKVVISGTSVTGRLETPAGDPSAPPTIARLEPQQARAGGPGFGLRVAGSGFVSGAIVRWKGADKPTTFVNSSELLASISAADVAVPGRARVTVFNPGGGEGVEPFFFTVLGPGVDSVRAFPNPFRPAQGHTAMTFAELPANARLRIYTLTGELVRDLTADAAGVASWDGRNQAGRDAASGVYFVLAQAEGEKNTFKVVVQR